MQYINYERKIEYSTLAKEAIKLQMKNEIIAEEMRLLYVALTRAKEKLIITGIDNTNNDIKNPKKAKTYMQWIKLACSILNESELENLETTYYTKNDLLQENDKKEMDSQNINIKYKNYSQKTDELLKWKYPNKNLTKIEGKSSVSKITKNNEQEVYDIKTPLFMAEKAILTKAEIGTTMHLILQKIDFQEKYNINKIEELINKLLENKIITKKQAESIRVQDILKFTSSNLFKKIKNADKIYKEQAFYINIPTNKIYDCEEEENILIQGIIDLYCLDTDGKLILVDYKTDYVPINSEQMLVDKYNKQLYLYKEALEKALGKKVKETYIYSTYLGKELLLDNL